MNNAKPRRTPAGAYLPLPIALGLAGLFFLPWLTLSCDPKAVQLPPEFRAATRGAVSLTKTTVLGTTTGWELARGEMTPAEQFEEQARIAQQQNQQEPPRKLWAYGGLLLPGLLGVVGLMALTGLISSSGAALWMILLGAGGVALMAMAACTDYVDIAMEQAREEMAASGAPFGDSEFEARMDEAAEKAKEVLQTKATPWLWACMGLHVLTFAGGLAVLGAQAPSYGQESQAEQAYEFEPVEYRADPVDPAAYLSSLPSAPGRDAREPTGMPKVPPGLKPLQQPAPTTDEDDATG